jgi:hypothetical protein
VAAVDSREINESSEGLELFPESGQGQDMSFFDSLHSEQVEGRGLGVALVLAIKTPSRLPSRNTIPRACDSGCSRLTASRRVRNFLIRLLGRGHGNPQPVI